MIDGPVVVALVGAVVAVALIVWLCKRTSRLNESEGRRFAAFTKRNAAAQAQPEAQEASRG